MVFPPFFGYFLPYHVSILKLRYAAAPLNHMICALSRRIIIAQNIKKGKHYFACLKHFF